MLRRLRLPAPRFSRRTKRVMVARAGLQGAPFVGFHTPFPQSWPGGGGGATLEESGGGALRVFVGKGQAGDLESPCLLTVGKRQVCLFLEREPQTIARFSEGLPVPECGRRWCPAALPGRPGRPRDSGRDPESAASRPPRAGLVPGLRAGEEGAERSSGRAEPRTPRPAPPRPAEPRSPLPRSSASAAGFLSARRLPLAVPGALTPDLPPFPGRLAGCPRAPLTAASPGSLLDSRSLAVPPLGAISGL